MIALATPENGGVFQYTQAVLDALASRKEFELVVFSQHREFDAHGAETHEISFDRQSLLTQLKMGIAVLVGSGSPRFVPARDRRRLDTVDFFYVPSMMPYPQLFFPKPYVVTIHDLLERHHPQFFSASERFQRNATNRAVARRARHVICESSFVRRDLVAFLGVNENKISVVPAPPPDAIATSTPTDEEVANVRRRHALDGDYLFYPAQCWPHKNHVALVRAFAKLRSAHPRLRLVFSGGRQGHYATVVEEIRALGLSDAVRHLGYLSAEDLRGVFRGARVIVVPTLFESISIPVYEAFALGVPACVSNVVGLPEQAGGAAQLFDPHDPAAIAEAIAAVLDDDALAKTLVERGHARMAQLRADDYGERLIAVLRRGFPETAS